MRKLIWKWLAGWMALGLLACSGGGLSGGGSAGGGPVGAPPPAPGPVAQGGGQMTAGDGTLGSQSSNVDISATFFRKYDLHFKDETPEQNAPLFEYTLAQGQTTLPSAQVKRLQALGMPMDCSECEGRWVRALYCGAYSDADI